jgi:hypothetical protein
MVGVDDGTCRGVSSREVRDVVVAPDGSSVGEEPPAAGGRVPWLR